MKIGWDVVGRITLSHEFLLMHMVREGHKSVRLGFNLDSGKSCDPEQLAEFLEFQFPHLYN